jgi:prepilin-type N-terminal cleavage/methylation domain-containing protein/prepilin-type processing-associated H-X9-DG protein
VLHAVQIIYLREISVASHIVRRRQHTTGFTLIEVLVVLGVLCILAALLFPVFRLVREKARQTSCTSNLLQLYKAMAMYAQDHEGRIAPYSNNIDQCIGDPTTPNKQYLLPEKGQELVQSLLPYTKSTAIWFCPTDRYRETNSQAGYLDHRYASYHSPWRLTVKSYSQLWPLRLDSPWGNVLLPGAEFAQGSILLSDESWTESIRYSYDTTMVRTPTPHLFSHNGRWNCLYFDGHIKSNAEGNLTYMNVCMPELGTPIKLP